MYEGPTDINNGVGNDHGSREWAGWRRGKGGNWDKCNSINNKNKVTIILIKSNTNTIFKIHKLKKLAINCQSSVHPVLCPKDKVLSAHYCVFS